MLGLLAFLLFQRSRVTMESAWARVTGILISLIGTVRNVGYRFVLPTKERFEAPAEQTEDA